MKFGFSLVVRGNDARPETFARIADAYVSKSAFRTSPPGRADAEVQAACVQSSAGDSMSTARIVLEVLKTPASEFARVIKWWF